MHQAPPEAAIHTDLGDAAALLRSVLDGMSEMVCRFRFDGTILFANRSYALSRGATPSGLEGKNFWDFIPDSDRAAVEAQLAALTPGNPEVIIENRFESSAGTIWTRWVNRALAFDAAGNWMEAQSTGIDITDRKRAEEALSESEARYRRLAESAPAMLWFADAQGVTKDHTRKWLDYTGQTREQAIGDGWKDIVHPGDIERVSEHWADCVRTGRDYAIEYRIRRACDGAYRWHLVEAVLSREEDGKPVGWFGACIDIEERKRAEAALSQSEERFRGIFRHAATGIAITDLEGRFQSCNPAYAAMVGYSEDELCALCFSDIVHPEDRESNMAEISRLLAQKISSFEILNRYLARDGKPIWVHKHVSLLRDPAGKPSNIIALVTDITERKRHEEQVTLLIREVNHRAKNMLALVQAIARQTAAKNPGKFLERFGARLRALSASQDLLVKAEWKGVDLKDLTLSQLAHFSDLIGARIELNGPALAISAQAAQTLGMALHELATNAGKYGALSNERGRVEIQWSLEPGDDGAPRFIMSWREREGPPLTSPSGPGFGSTVIAGMVRLGLDADVKLDFRQDGLIWRVDCLSEKVLERDNLAAFQEMTRTSGRV